MDHVSKLKYLLERTEFTQQSLADRVGVSFVSLNAWVNGRAQARQKAQKAIDGVFACAAAGMSLSAREWASGVTESRSQDGLSSQQVDQLLRGEGDREAIDVLRERQHDKFLRRLPEIVERAPLGAVCDAMILLDAAKDRDSEACTEFLMYPNVALWAATCLRSQLGVLNDGLAEQHVAHLSSIAAVAAWKCGVDDFSIAVPLRNGEVALPSLGRALLWGDEELAEAQLQCRGGRLRVVTSTQTLELPVDLDNQTHEWEPIRRLTFRSGEHELHLMVDDVDPYRLTERTLSPSISSRRLDQLEFKTLKEQYGDAWTTIVENHREYAVGVAAILRVLVPIEDSILHSTWSSAEGCGALLATIGVTPTWAAMGLVEETQRMKIKALHEVETIHTSTIDTAAFLAPFADMPRPLFNLVDTFYASPAVAQLWRTQFLHSYGTEQFEAAVNCERAHLWQESLYYQLIESGELTALGRRLAAEIRGRGAEGRDDIPESIVTFTRELAIDQGLCARITNIASDADDLERLAAAWLAGRSCPVNIPVNQYLVSQPTHHVVGRKRRRQLGEIRLTHPEKFEDIVDNEHYLDLVVAGASQADAYLVAERYEDARQRYCDAITADSHDAESWAGLAVVCARWGTEAVLTLGRFPELIAALHQHLGDVHGRQEDPMRLAKWLEPLLIRMDDEVFGIEQDLFGGPNAAG